LGGILEIGEVVRPHGVKGQIRVHCYGDDLQSFLTLKEIQLGHHPESLATHRIIKCQPHKGSIILTVQDFNFDEARKSVGRKVWVRRDQLPALEEDEYYWQDLIGFRVLGDDGKELGIVENLMATGSNDILVCRCGDEELLVPFIEDFVLQVNTEARSVTVRMAEGMT
jgi:16S rRNA processing protein RimM